MVVTRITDGNRRTVRFSANGESLEASSAEAGIRRFLMPSFRNRSDTEGAIASILTRGVYLQQDVVRQFIDTDTPSERFQLIGGIVGAGEVLALQTLLEKSRNQWSRTITSKRRDELAPIEAQVERIDDQLKRLVDASGAGVPDTQSASSRLLEAALELIGQSRISLRSPPTSSNTLDRLLAKRDLGRARQFGA